MKKLHALFFALLLCTQVFGQGQPTPAIIAGKSELVLVVPATGSQDELFIRGKDWLFRTYNSGKTVEQYEDKAAGRIVAHAQTQGLTWKAGFGIVNDAGTFKYDLTIDFKDSKARLTIDNIIYQRGTQSHSMILKSGANLADEYPANWSTLGRKSMLEHWQVMQAQASNELSLLAQSFQAALTKPKSDF